MSKIVYRNGVKYYVEKYYLPASLKKRYEFLVNFFKLMDDVTIDMTFRRRKTDCEFVEYSMFVAAKIQSLLDLGMPIVLGSRYLYSKPWVTLGECEYDSVYKFSNLKELFKEMYLKPLTLNNSIDAEFLIRNDQSTFNKISESFNIPRSQLLYCCLNFLSDVILLCGPDCDIISDLFENDYRISPDFIDLDNWSTIREIIMGPKGRILQEPFDFFIGLDGQIPEEKVTFQEIAFEKLEEGLRTYKTAKPNYASFHEGDDDDYYNYYYGPNSHLLNTRCVNPNNKHLVDKLKIDFDQLDNIHI